MLERSTLSLAEWLDHQGAPGDELVESIAHAARHFARSPGIVSLRAGLAVAESGRLPFHQAESALDQIGLLSDHVRGRLDKWRPGHLPARSAERLGWKEWVSTCSSRWSPILINKNKQH